MEKTVEAVYEHGVLRPLENLGLADGQHVRVTISDLAVLADNSNCFEPAEWAAALEDDISLENVRRALSRIRGFFVRYRHCVPRRALVAGSICERLLPRYQRPGEALSPGRWFAICRASCHCSRVKRRRLPPVASRDGVRACDRGPDRRGRRRRPRTGTAPPTRRCSAGTHQGRAANRRAALPQSSRSAPPTEWREAFELCTPSSWPL